MASTWLEASSEARRLPPSVNNPADAGSRYYIMGVLLALGIILGVFMLWARCRFPVVRRVTLAVATPPPAKTRQTTPPPIFDVFVAPTNVHAALWTDMLPLSLSLLPPRTCAAGKENAGLQSVPAHVAALVAMPSLCPEECFEFAVGTVEVKL
ncbi:hypothetical protein MIND_00163600 [Mycena indigotica]|uniref:Uncharacterized protein n=1 Tax=Mycena indigotica TaxID=2126181 RepID=A0A8H6TFK5_9AGAR|nr:uncharacterized protein MIND_00163600 [Mycena indigotica]KAF7316446.1 hypothetical protein MIND_00163600 [Mycena indigotica]